MGEFLKGHGREMIAKHTLNTLLLLASMFLMSCTSQIPVATNHPYIEQQKMQAAHHWEVLAYEVVITTSVKNKHTYVMSHTGTYYINTPHWDSNYALQGKIIEVVNQ